MIIEIPFTGFYYSGHDVIMDNEIEYYFQDDSGDVETHADLMDEFYSKANFSLARARYAKEYADHYLWLIQTESELELDVKPSHRFHELYSPRFYNYETDRIFIHVTKRFVNEVYSKVIADPTMKECLSNMIRDAATGYDGYSPFSETIEWAETWETTPVTEWEAYQLRILFEAILDSKTAEECCFESSFTENLDLFDDLPELPEKV